MLYFLKGITAALEPGLAVIECAGVGYACKTTSFTLSGLQPGKPATLYTHLSVREDGIELYGLRHEGGKTAVFAAHLRLRESAQRPPCPSCPPPRLPIWR